MITIWRDLHLNWPHDKHLQREINKDVEVFLLFWNRKTEGIKYLRKGDNEKCRIYFSFSFYSSCFHCGLHQWNISKNVSSWIKNTIHWLIILKMNCFDAFFTFKNSSLRVSIYLFSRKKICVNIFPHHWYFKENNGYYLHKRDY